MAKFLRFIAPIILCASSLFAQNSGFYVPSVDALKTDLEIHVDGQLSESSWQEAPSVTDFRQIQPEEGAAATERTAVRVLYNETDLYIGVICFDSEPELIVAQKLQRDSGVDDDDMFAFVLDTYRDRRTAYYFATNPNGVEEDGQVTDTAFGSTNLDWDGVWEVRTHINQDGWSAEFRIPLWNLRFAGVPEQTWGINFTRIIKRKTEQVNWASWSRNNGGFLRISRAGDLKNLSGFNQSLNLQVKPYTLGASRWSDLLEPSSNRDDNWDGGFDVKLGLSSNVTLDLTANTDFAQVEADVEQVNLTRFPLFFPEKREFFLESANIFHFGQGGFFGPPPFLLFFSRRVGIEGVDIVPILAGGRITGKIGRYNVGLIDILTDDQTDIVKSHFTVARLSRDILQRSRVGVMFTNRADLGEFHQQAYGVDGNIWLSNPLEFQTFYSMTHDQDTGVNSRAWKLGLDFTKDHWGWFASHISIDDDFDPAVGFVLRRDIHQSQLSFRVSPQPNGKLLRRTDIRQNFTRITTQSGRLQDWTYGISVNNNLSSGDYISFGYDRSFERLDMDFNFRSGILVPAGDYQSNELSMSFTSSSKRRYWLSASTGWREFYGGDLFGIGGGLGFVPSRHYSFSLEYNRNQIELPQGDLNTDLFSFRLNAIFTTHLFLNTLIQYNSESNELSTNLRFNFIHSPGSDLFIVYNENRGRMGADFFDGLPTKNREIILKLTKLFKI